MKVNHIQYLDNPRFYCTAIESLAIKVEQAIINRLWCNDDSKLDEYDYAIELAKIELFKVAGDECLLN